MAIIVSNPIIYEITSPSGAVYIGQTHHKYRRFKDYSVSKCKNQHHLYASIKKHGWDSHTVNELIELRLDISQPMLDYWESYFIEYYKSLGTKMMNIRGGGAYGKFPEETKAKMSASAMGKKHSAEHKARVSQGLLATYRLQKRGRFRERPVFTKSIHGQRREITQMTLDGKFVKDWPSILSASKGMNCSRGLIRNCLTGACNTGKGFTWKYKYPFL